MKTIVFNLDCMMDFLKAGRTDLLEREFRYIIISNKVYKTLLNPSIPQYIRDELNLLIKKNFIRVEEISYNTNAFEIYYEIANNPDKEIMGESEASSIALAVKNKKALAFNNHSLIETYIKEYNLKCISTNGILERLLDKKIISKDDFQEIINELNNKN